LQEEARTIIIILRIDVFSRTVRDYSIDAEEWIKINASRRVSIAEVFRKRSINQSVLYKLSILSFDISKWNWVA
jgi:hypothetical protein